MRLECANADAVIARIAADQHGVVTLAQLIAAGLKQSAIARRVRMGLLHRVFRGVYAVGHAGLSTEGGWMAAVLACGDGAVLSHRSGAYLWRMLEPRGGPIDVTIPSSSGRKRRKGIRLHRSPSMPNDATTRQDGIAVTTPARTLTDLKRVVSPGLHRKATRQAEFLKLDIGEIVTDHTRSEGERRFLGVCRRHRVPPPQVNVRVGPYTVDFLWPDAGLVVEVDGYDGHRGRQGFEDDHARELYLVGRGLRLRRFTNSQVYNQGEAVTRAVLAELALSSRMATDKRQPAS
jgi:very-short-patch-repair endonuclease